MSAGKRLLATLLLTGSALSQSTAPAPDQGEASIYNKGASHVTLANLPLTPEFMKDMAHPAEEGVDHFTWINDPNRKHSRAEKAYLNKVALYSAELGLDHVPNIVRVTLKPGADGTLASSKDANEDPITVQGGHEDIGGLITYREDLTSKKGPDMTSDELGYATAHELVHEAQIQEKRTLFLKNPGPQSIGSAVYEDDADVGAVELSANPKGYKRALTKLEPFSRKAYEKDHDPGETFDHWSTTGDNPHSTFPRRLANADSEGAHLHKFAKPLRVPKL